MAKLKFVPYRNNMDPDTLENWRKIKQHLEAAGKTDCDFYKRACVIVDGNGGRKDPGPRFD